MNLKKRVNKRELLEIAVITGVLMVAKSVVFITARGYYENDWLKNLSLRWDGEHFVRIASEGYSEEYLMAFAPLYPLSIAAISKVFGLSYWLSAFLVANFFSFIPPIILNREKGIGEALFLVLNPAYVLYTSVPYSEAMALTFLLIGLYLFMSRKYTSSGILFALAMLTRYNSVLGAGMLLLILLWKRELRNTLRFSFPLVLAGIAILAFFWIKLGNPLGYFEIEKTWDSGITTPVQQAKWIMKSWFTDQPWKFNGWHIGGIHWLIRNYLFIAIYLFGVILLFNKKRPEEGVYSLPYLVIQTVIKGIPSISTPRLLLPAVPAWSVYGNICRKKALVIIGVITLPSMIALHYITLWHIQAFFA
jgi:Gpi18-like mannosyltransferase